MNFSRPTGTSQVPGATSEVSPVQHRSFPKDVAENGAAGASGGAAYEALKHHEQDTSAPTYRDDPLASSAHPKVLEGYADQRAAPTHDAHQVGHEPTVGSKTMETGKKDHHYGRDAALVGGGTAAASGAHEYSKHHEDKLEHEREKTAEHKHKEAEKVRKHEEKERKHEEKDKKPSLISRILHPHKGKEGHHEEEHESRRSSENSRFSHDKHRDEAAVGAAGAAGVAGAGHEHDKHDRNRLHKEPKNAPEGYMGGIRSHEGESSGMATGPHSGHAEGGQHSHIVTEPHTGLPMDLSKGAGSGAGGTDGAANIEGFHEGAGGQGTHWQDIKKANTPY